jgi:predicted SnoaL-like aldol condensation-catalyzing enzyme
MANLPNNEKIVVDFYQGSFDGDPTTAVDRHVGSRYTQHNPEAEDGSDAFIGFVNDLRGRYPDLKLDIKRVIAEGDLVVTHAHLVLTPGQPGRALADFWRVLDGKIIEHWDVVQDVPDTAANSNTMF